MHSPFSCRMQDESQQRREQNEDHDHHRLYHGGCAGDRQSSTINRTSSTLWIDRHRSTSTTLRTTMLGAAEGSVDS